MATKAKEPSPLIGLIVKVVCVNQIWFIGKVIADIDTAITLTCPKFGDVLIFADKIVGIYLNPPDADKMPCGAGDDKNG